MNDQISDEEKEHEGNEGQPSLLMIMAGLFAIVVAFCVFLGILYYNQLRKNASLRARIVKLESGQKQSEAAKPSFPKLDCSVLNSNCRVAIASKKPTQIGIDVFREFLTAGAESASNESTEPDTFRRPDNRLLFNIFDSAGRKTDESLITIKDQNGNVWLRAYANKNNEGGLLDKVKQIIVIENCRLAALQDKSK